MNILYEKTTIFSKQGDFRASERRAELVRAMPSAAENHEVNK